MTDPQTNEPGGESQSPLLPDAPEAAFLVASLFQKLGGSFQISSNGTRYAGAPTATRFMAGGMPVLPYSRPHERFLNDDEWLGAIKVLDYAIRRLSPADKDFVFDIFALSALDSRGGFDFREQMS